MPIKRVNYVSPEDLAQKLDAIQGSEAKLEYAQNYLLSYNADKAEPDLDDLISVKAVLVAKNKIAEALVKEGKKPSLDAEDKASLFVGNPLKYLDRQANSNFWEAEDDPQMQYRFAKITGNILAYSDALRDAERRENNRSAFQRLEDKLPEDSSLKDQIAGCKAGFFERTFGTTSNEYKNFEQELLHFGPETTDTRSLETTSLAYLKHKFPALKDGELPTEEQINSLSGAGKNRAMLALNTYKSIQEKNMQSRVKTMSNDCAKYSQQFQEKQDKELADTVDRISKQKLEASNYDFEKKAYKEPEKNVQQDFHKQLSEDVKDIPEEEMTNLIINDVSSDLSKDSYDDLDNEDLNM